MKRYLIYLLVFCLAATGCKPNQPQITERVVYVRTRVTCTGDVSGQAECDKFYDDLADSGSLSSRVTNVQLEIKKSSYDSHYAAFKISADNTDSAWGWGQYLTFEPETGPDEPTMKVTNFIMVGIGIAFDDETLKELPSDMRDYLPKLSDLGLNPVRRPDVSDSLKKLKGF